MRLKNNKPYCGEDIIPTTHIHIPIIIAQDRKCKFMAVNRFIS